MQTRVLDQPRWVYLGGDTMTVAAPNSNTVTIPAYDYLRITISVTGYAGSGIVSIQFGATAGAVDTGNNYLARWLTSTAGASTFNNAALNTQPRIQCSNTAVATSRYVQAIVQNIATIPKNVQMSTITNAGSTVTSQPVIETGNGMWVNTTSQIVSIRLITSTGNNLNIGTSFVVEGMNRP